MSPGAVITADIANSTKISKAAVKKIMHQISVVFTDHKLEFFRGDSFQVYIKDAKEALGLILLVRTAVIRIEKECDIRASIGIDLIKNPIKQLSTATADAFVISGREFDSMQKGRKLVITTNEKNALVNSSFRILTQFIDYMFTHMTSKQVIVVYELMMKRSQTEIAKRLKKSQATIHKHIYSSGWPEIEKLMVEYGNLVQSIKT